MKEPEVITKLKILDQYEQYGWFPENVRMPEKDFNELRAYTQSVQGELFNQAVKESPGYGVDFLKFRGVTILKLKT